MVPSMEVLGWSHLWRCWDGVLDLSGQELFWVVFP